MVNHLSVIKSILIIAFVVVLLAVVGVASYQAGHSSSNTPGAVTLENVFVDLNNDGRLDLLVSGVAVMNELPLSVTSTPPAKK